MKAEELRQLIGLVGNLRGWDWSRIHVDRDPEPWNYIQVVRRYLTPTSYVLDVGTGGVEIFYNLHPHFGRGAAWKALFDGMRR